VLEASEFLNSHILTQAGNGVAQSTASKAVRKKKCVDDRVFTVSAKQARQVQG